MSSYEKIATNLDELRSARQSMRVPNIDFDEYMENRQQDIASVKTPLDFQDDVIEFFHGGGKLIGATMPWEKTHHNIRFRPGEVSCWHGYNGHGKSQVLGQVINGLAAQGEKCCIASFEMHPYKTLARMTRQVIGTNDPSAEYIQKYFDWANGKIWFYDQQGTVEGKRVIAVIHYVAETFGVTHFVVDSLMKCGIGTDDYNGQKMFIDKLCACAKDTGVHIHLVAHDKKPTDESVLPHKYMIAGSGDISNQVDNCFGVWRNKAKEHDLDANELKEDALIICDKQRNGEYEGNVTLYFHKASFRYLGAAREAVWAQI